MSYRPNRLRRPASPKKLQALQLAGWRYSSKRSAWVHRAFKGRVGPVYVDPADDHPRIAESIVIDHQGPRRRSETPTAGDAMALESLLAVAASPAQSFVLPAPDDLTPQTVAEVVITDDTPSTLPQRVLARHRPELARLPLPARPLDLSTGHIDQIHVHVQLSELEEPRLVRVDGRPPRRGVDARRRGADDRVVVPIKSFRAFG